jgi:hypothetical protein
MNCKFCNKEIERCTHAALHEEIERLTSLMNALEAARQKIDLPGVIMVRSLISHRTTKPRIDIQVGDIHTQMDADSAMDVAKNIIEVCEGAYADAFIFHFVTERLSQEMHVGAAIIEDFREYRERLTEEFRQLQKQGPTSGEKRETS